MNLASMWRSAMDGALGSVAVRLMMAKLDGIRAEAARRRRKAAARRPPAWKPPPGTPRDAIGRLDAPEALPRLGTPVRSAYHRLSGRRA